MRRRHRLPASLLLVVIAAVAVVWTAGAHATVGSAEPAPDSTVPEPPEQVRAWFTEELDPDGSTMQVYGPDGEVADVGDGAVDLNDPDRMLMTVTLQPDLSPGLYTVEWETLSLEDDHAERGSFTFTYDPDAAEVQTPVVAAPAPDATAEPIPVDEVSEPDSGFSRAGIIIGIVAVVAALGVVGTLGRRRRSR